jgi:hypothetical protein
MKAAAKCSDEVRGHWQIGRAQIGTTGAVVSNEANWGVELNVPSASSLTMVAAVNFIKMQGIAGGATIVPRKAIIREVFVKLGNSTPGPTVSLTLPTITPPVVNTVLPTNPTTGFQGLLTAGGAIVGTMNNSVDPTNALLTGGVILGSVSQNISFPISSGTIVSPSAGAAPFVSTPVGPFVQTGSGLIQTGSVYRSVLLSMYISDFSATGLSTVKDPLNNVQDALYDFLQLTVDAWMEPSSASDVSRSWGFTFNGEIVLLPGQALFVTISQSAADDSQLFFVPFIRSRVVYPSS